MHHHTLNLIIGLVALSIWIYMMQNSVAEKIRNSKYWGIGWLGSLVLLGIWAENLFHYFFCHAH